MKKQPTSKDQAVRVDEVIARTEEQLRQRKAQAVTLEKKYKAYMQQLEQLHNVVNASPYSFLDENDYSQMVGDFYMDLLEGLRRQKGEEYEKAKLELEHIYLDGQDTGAEDFNDEIHQLRQRIGDYTSEITALEQQIDQLLDQETSVEQASQELLYQLAEEIMRRSADYFAELNRFNDVLQTDEKRKEVQRLQSQIEECYAQLEFQKARHKRSALEATGGSVLTAAMRKTVLEISVYKLKDQLEVKPFSKATRVARTCQTDGLAEEQVYWLQQQFEAARADLKQRGIDIEDV